MRPPLKKVYAAVVIAGLATALFWPQISWLWKSDRDKIEYAIMAIAEGGSRRNVGDVTAHISASYKDRFHSDKDKLTQTIRWTILHFRKIEVTISNLNIELDESSPDVAIASFSAIILGGSDPKEKPRTPIAKSYRGSDSFFLRLRREGSVWRVTSSGTSEDPLDQ